MVYLIKYATYSIDTKLRRDETCYEGSLILINSCHNRDLVTD